MAKLPVHDGVVRCPECGTLVTITNVSQQRWPARWMFVAAGSSPAILFFAAVCVGGLPWLQSCLWWAAWIAVFVSPLILAAHFTMSERRQGIFQISLSHLIVGCYSACWLILLALACIGMVLLIAIVKASR